MQTLTLKTEKILAHSDNDGLGWITFNNPARHNALSLEMWQGLADALDALERNTRVRAVILRGAGGKAFVSGADISEFDEQRSSSTQKAHYGAIAGRANRALSSFSKPLIAMIQGYCIGGGLATALAADIRFATPESRFGIPAAKLGLGYDYPGIARLASLVGSANSSDILFSARLLSSEEALRIGLINFCGDAEVLENQVREYARGIAANAPLTVRAAKAALRAYDRGGRKEEIAEVQQRVDACFDSADYKEGRKAFQQKRLPQFRGE